MGLTQQSAGKGSGMPTMKSPSLWCLPISEISCYQLHASWFAKFCKPLLQTSATGSRTLWEPTLSEPMPRNTDTWISGCYLVMCKFLESDGQLKWRPPSLSPEHPQCSCDLIIRKRHIRPLLQRSTTVRCYRPGPWRQAAGFRVHACLNLGG